jgi:predicted DNA-binding transcriptional regulator AlpA
MPRLKLHEATTVTPIGLTDPPPTGSAVEPLLIPAGVAGPLCGRSEASWWRDHAAGRVPAPVKLGGRTPWRVEELRRWVESGCPDRRAWEALKKSQHR